MESHRFSVKTYSAANDYPITTPTGRIVNPPESRCWVTSKERFNELVADNRIWFGKTGNNVPSLKKFLTEVKDGTTALTVWLYEEVGHNQDAKKEVKQFNSKDVFDTPKPERLLERILTLATNPGDLVLDSFAGSGTTGAVAHKMGRRWIMVELGEHCHTHIIPRLQKVIDGEDQGAFPKRSIGRAVVVSAITNWRQRLSLMIIGAIKSLTPNITRRNWQKRWQRFRVLPISLRKLCGGSMAIRANAILFM